MSTPSTNNAPAVDGDQSVSNVVMEGGRSIKGDPSIDKLAIEGGLSIANVADLGANAAREIGAALAGVDEAAVATLREQLRSATAIATYGVGREGLVMRSFAMRLYHLGLRAFVVGDMSAPPLARGGLLVTSAGPGTFSTVAALIGVARAAGAHVALFTSHPDAPLAAEADVVVRIPAQTMAGGPASTQLMGSIYEQAMWVLGDAIIDQLVTELQLDRTAITERHTNLE
jgi:6-phospho-3-hexuloisomerase